MPRGREEEAERYVETHRGERERLKERFLENADVVDPQHHLDVASFVRSE